MNSINRIKRTQNIYDVVPKDLLPQNNWKILNVMDYTINQFFPKYVWLYLQELWDNIINYYEWIFSELREWFNTKMQKDEFNKFMMVIINDVIEWNGSLQKIYLPLNSNNYKILVSVSVIWKHLNIDIDLYVKRHEKKDWKEFIKYQIWRIFNKDELLREKYYKEGLAVHYKGTVWIDVFSEHQIYWESVDDLLSEIKKRNWKVRWNISVSVAKKNTVASFVDIVLPIPNFDSSKQTVLKELLLSSAEMYEKI